MSASNDEFDGYLWVVMPIGWEYDNLHYRTSGYDLPKLCFTLKEMAEQYALDQSILKFKEIATQDYFAGYGNLDEIGYKIAIKKNNKPLAQTVEDITKKFCKEWGIMDNYSISESKLREMSEEKILELMLILDIKFYTISKVKIYC